MVEYCSPVWSPFNTGLINKLESVQRRFTKSLSGMSSSYSERLRWLNLDSFRADLMLWFMIMKGFVDVDASEFFKRAPLDTVTLGYRYKLVCPNGRIN